MKDYFNAGLSWEDYKARQTALAAEQAGFDPAAARKKALASEAFDPQRVVLYALRPFETRWSYYTQVSPIWNRARPSLWAQCWAGNEFLVTRPAGVASPEGVPFFHTHLLGDNDFLRGHAYYFALRLRNSKRLSRAAHETLFAHLEEEPEEDASVANLSKSARDYMKAIKLRHSDAYAQTSGLVWMHALAIGYSPRYLSENADGIRRDWPRIPLPDRRKALQASAALGRKVAALLDTEGDLLGVTAGAVEGLFRSVGVLTKVGGGELDPDAGDLAVTAGWGHSGKEGVTMPAKGRIVERPFDKDELEALSAAAKARGLSVKQALALLGPDTRDVYLSGGAYWKNVPAGVWEFYIGGYQVIKKWLSYREEELLGRALRAEEAREVTHMARRLAAIVLLQPALDENYRRVKASAYPWPLGPPAG
jgi:hypothetical protein